MENRFCEEFGEYRNLDELREMADSVENPPNKWTAEAAEKIAAIVEQLADAVNGGDREYMATVMAITMSREHRTLQASIVRLFVDFCRIYRDFGFDLRNRGAVELADKVAAMYEAGEIAIPVV
jgi:delta 1-pyrroline-5-carboxylate dehydrogenase